MLQEEHDKFLELVVEYYNRREDWVENNTRLKGIAYRKVLKDLAKHCKLMQDGIRDIQWQRRLDNIKTFQEQGYVPRKGKPR